jgi:hypothetical protein
MPGTGAGAVAEDESGAAVGRADQSRESFGTDDQDVLGGATANHVAGESERVAEPGARGRDVKGGGALGADQVGDPRSQRGDLLGVGAGRQDHRVDLGRLDPGYGQRLLCCGKRHRLEGLVRADPATFLDAGPLLDPLVAGVDRVDYLGVGDDPLGAMDAESEHRCVRGADWHRPGGGHAGTPSGKPLANTVPLMLGLPRDEA